MGLLFLEFHPGLISQVLYAVLHLSYLKKKQGLVESNRTLELFYKKMKIIKFIEEKFWLPLIIALILGLLIPTFGKSLIFLIIPFLMIILFLTYLKTDLIEIISHIKKPFFTPEQICNLLRNFSS